MQIMKKFLALLTALVLLSTLCAAMAVSASALELPERPTLTNTTDKEYVAFKAPAEPAVTHQTRLGAASALLTNGGTIVVTQKALYSFKDAEEQSTIDGTRGTILVTAKEGDTSYINIDTDGSETGIILGNNGFREENMDKVDYLRLEGNVIFDDIVLFNRAHPAGSQEPMPEPNTVLALSGSRVVIGSNVVFAHRYELPNMALIAEKGAVVFIDSLGFSKYTGEGILVLKQDLVSQVNADTFAGFEGAVVDESGKLLYGTEPAAPVETEAPETEAPETKAPETKAPETKAPETKAPETKAATGDTTTAVDTTTTGEEGGIPAYVWVIIGVVAVAAVACGVILATKKKKA